MSPRKGTIDSYGRIECPPPACRARRDSRLIMAIATPIQIRFERFNGDIGIAPAKPPVFVAPEDKPALVERARRLL